MLLFFTHMISIFKDLTPDLSQYEQWFNLYVSVSSSLLHSCLTRYHPPTDFSIDRWRQEELPSLTDRPHALLFPVTSNNESSVTTWYRKSLAGRSQLLYVSFFILSIDFLSIDIHSKDTSWCLYVTSSLSLIFSLFAHVFLISGIWLLIFLQHGQLFNL